MDPYSFYCFFVFDLCYFLVIVCQCCVFLCCCCFFSSFVLWLTTLHSWHSYKGNSFRVFLFSLLRTPGCVISFFQERPGSSPGRFWYRRPTLTRLPRLPSSVCPMSVIARPTDLWDGKKNLCLWLKSCTVLMSPNKEETAIHGCSSYMHCSYSVFAHACRFWPNRGVEFEWYFLSTAFPYFHHRQQRNSSKTQFKTMPSSNPTKTLEKYRYFVAAKDCKRQMYKWTVQSCYLHMLFLQVKCNLQSASLIKREF